MPLGRKSDFIRACAPLGALVLLGFTVPSAHGTNGSVDIFGDRSGTTCQKTMALVDSIYVMARLGGATSSGIHAASFRIDGMPPTWLVLGIAPNPHVKVWVGSPFISSGTLISFDCQAGNANDLVQLFAIGIFVPRTPPLQDVRLTVRSYPFSPTTTTPLLFLCNPPDPPGYLAFPALGGEFIANPQTSSCAVGLQTATWSSIKSLYASP